MIESKPERSTFFVRAKDSDKHTSIEMEDYSKMRKSKGKKLRSKDVKSSLLRSKACDDLEAHGKSNESSDESDLEDELIEELEHSRFVCCPVVFDARIKLKWLFASVALLLAGLMIGALVLVLTGFLTFETKAMIPCNGTYEAKLHYGCRFPYYMPVVVQCGIEDATDTNAIGFWEKVDSLEKQHNTQVDVYTALFPLLSTKLRVHGYVMFDMPSWLTFVDFQLEEVELLHTKQGASLTADSCSLASTAHSTKVGVATVYSCVKE